MGRRVAVLEGGYSGWEGQRLPAGSLSLGCRAAAGSVCTWHVAAAQQRNLSLFRFSLCPILSLCSA